MSLRIISDPKAKKPKLNITEPAMNPELNPASLLPNPTPTDPKVKTPKLNITEPAMNSELNLASSLPNSTTSSSVLDSSSTPTDLNEAEKPKLNIPDTYVSKVGWTREDLLLSLEEWAGKAWEAYFAERKKNPPTSTYRTKYDPEEPLPEGFAWGSFVPGSGRKQFTYKPMCYDCGGPAHSTDHCLDFDDPESVAFRKAAYTVPMHKYTNK